MNLTKFQFSPGLPGYGTKGNNGSDGSIGLSMYFTNLNGDNDYISIRNKIINNQNLWSSNVLPNNRSYQTGDTFVDQQGKVWSIDFSKTYKFIYTGFYLSAAELFSLYDVKNDVGVSRYSNLYMGTTDVIDSVFSTTVNSYTQYPSTIYGIKPVNFGRIEYSDIKPPESQNYNPFTLFTSGINDKSSIALVRDNVNNQFHLGNLDPCTLTRDIDLIFDFNQIIVSRDVSNSFNQYSADGIILTNHEITANNLVNPVFNTSPTSWKATSSSSDVSIYWDLNDIVGTYDLSKVTADLYICSDISVNKYQQPRTFYVGLDSSTLIFRQIDPSGFCWITGLASERTYHTFIKVYQNGWERETKRLKIIPGQVSQLDISINAYPTSLDPTDISAGQNGIGFNLDLSTNYTWTISGANSWLHIVPTSGAKHTRANWNDPTNIYHDVSIVADSFSSSDITRVQNITVTTDGGNTKTFTMTQYGPQSPRANINVTTHWNSARNIGAINGYAGYVVLLGESSPGSGDYDHGSAQYWSISGSLSTADQNHIFSAIAGLNYKLECNFDSTHVTNYWIKNVINGTTVTTTQQYTGSTTGTASRSNAFVNNIGSGAAVSITFQY